MCTTCGLCESLFQSSQTVKLILVLYTLYRLSPRKTDAIKFTYCSNLNGLALLRLIYSIKYVATSLPGPFLEMCHIRLSFWCMRRSVYGTISVYELQAKSKELDHHHICSITYARIRITYDMPHELACLNLNALHSAEVLSS